MPTAWKHQAQFLPTAYRERPRTDRGCDGKPLWEDHSRIFGGQSLSCGRLDRRCFGRAITSSLGCTKWGRCFASAIRTDLVPSYPDDGNTRSAFPHHRQGLLSEATRGQMTVAGRWALSHPSSTPETEGLSKGCSSAGLLAVDVSSMRFVSDAVWRFCEDNRVGGGLWATIRTFPYHKRGLMVMFLSTTQVSLPSLPPVSRIHSIPRFLWHSILLHTRA